MEGLEDLLSMAAQLAVWRYEILELSIQVAYAATLAGPGAVSSVAAQFKWSSQTITRLAQLHDLPKELWSPELALGVYWLTRDMPAVERDAFLRKAIEEEWSVADAKEALGLQVERTGGRVWRGEVEGRNGQVVVVTGEEFDGADLPAGAPVSVRRLAG